jgi:hypothetical protein
MKQLLILQNFIPAWNCKLYFRCGLWGWSRYKTGHFLLWHFSHQIWKAVKLYFTTYLISHSNQDRDYSYLGCDVWCTMIGRYQFSGHTRCHHLQSERVWRKWRWMQLVPLKCYSVATIVCKIISQKETISIPFNLNIV